MAATCILGDIACGLLNRPQQKKSDNQQGEQQFKDALKSLGITATPENVTINDVTSKEFDKGKYDEKINTAENKISDAKSKMESNKNLAKSTREEINSKKDDLQ